MTDPSAKTARKRRPCAPPLVGAEVDALCQVIAQQVRDKGLGHNSRVLALMGVPVEPIRATSAAPK